MATARSTLRPFGDAADGGNVDRELRSILGGNAKAADREVALRHRIDLPVRAIKRGEDQRAAAQALGLADGRDGHVDALAGLGEGGEFRSDHHRCSILEPRRDACGQLHAKAARNALHRLGEVFEVVVAGPGQADHHAVAGELVGAHALECAKIAHALGLGGQGGRAAASATNIPTALMLSLSKHARNLGHRRGAFDRLRLSGSLVW